MILRIVDFFNNDRYIKIYTKSEYKIFEYVGLDVPKRFSNYNFIDYIINKVGNEI